MIKLTHPFVGKPIYVHESAVDGFLGKGYKRVVVEPVVKPVKKPVKKSK